MQVENNRPQRKSNTTNLLRAGALRNDKAVIGNLYLRVLSGYVPQLWIESASKDPGLIAQGAEE
jgi:hypothetical protein